MEIERRIGWGSVPLQVVDERRIRNGNERNAGVPGRSEWMSTASEEMVKS